MRDKKEPALRRGRAGVWSVAVAMGGRGATDVLGDFRIGWCLDGHRLKIIAGYGDPQFYSQNEWLESEWPAGHLA